MNKATQWKITITIIIVALSLWFLYPSFQWYTKSPGQQQKLREIGDPIVGKILKLGLDLQGGMRLRLEVERDKIPEGMEIEEAMNRALEIIRNRVDQFGVSEPLIARQGVNWIIVQLPGIADVERALDLIGQTALLEFKLVADQPVGDEEDIPEGYEILPGRQERERYLVKEEAELTGAALKNAEVKVGGDFGRPRISFTMKKDAAQEFQEITELNVNRRLAIVLDGVVQSAPNIRERIPNGQGIIEGNFTMESARDLAIVLRAGALPAPVTIIEKGIVGPKLGQDSIVSGLKAMGIGLALIMLFMVAYYKKSGIIAVIALLLNIIILLGAMAYFQFTLTLPGIAGIILIIGMAVDANVLIFDRIMEETDKGKTPRVAIDAGYKKATTTILDANITTLIAVMFLFQFGTGPVKGFAVTLFIGIVVSMFTAIIVAKTIFDMITSERQIKELSI
ncbi:MAG: protein translocase subunit SecD [Elusimicrobiota bacterium]|nr:protein translocase subunit SecD [Elusimicrobiota bacterium]